MVKNKKAAVALSGGVDSAFCAYLLLQEGYDVEAFTLKIPFLPGGYLKRASLFCGKLGIPHHIIDVEKEFKEKIIKYFIDSYLAGLTPNPCARCNRVIKFGLLFKEAEKIKFDIFATGHYAGIVNKSGRFYIKKASRENNSQEYFLALLPEGILKYCVFPLGGYTKKEVETKAKKMYSVRVPSSREICFIINKNYREFISSVVGNKHLYEGFIRYHDGRVLKKHNGIYNYTYGQREGLGVSWHSPLYVLDINPVTKDVIVAEKELVLKDKFYVSGLNWFCPPADYNNIFVRLRYNAKLLSCGIKLQSDKKALCVLTNNKDIPSPGQLACFYDNDTIIAGGTIEKYKEQG